MKNPPPNYKIVYVEGRWHMIYPTGYVSSWRHFFRSSAIRRAWDDYTKARRSELAKEIAQS